jgi:hypothetical protein
MIVNEILKKQTELNIGIVIDIRVNSAKKKGAVNKIIFSGKIN